MKSPYSQDTREISFEGAGAAGVHEETVSLMPGRYAMTAGGTAGGATLTAQLEDRDGNSYDIPNAGRTAAETIPSPYPVEIASPGTTLVLATTGAGATTDLMITVGQIE